MSAINPVYRDYPCCYSYYYS